MGIRLMSNEGVEELGKKELATIIKEDVGNISDNKEATLLQ